MSIPSAQQLPGLPRDDDGPVFAEPWQAQAFALTVKLNEGGHFAWSEWAAILGQEIRQAGPNDDPADYYLHWLSALEKIIQNKKILKHGEFDDRKSAWDRAARATPHGEPIELGRDKK